MANLPPNEWTDLAQSLPSLGPLLEQSDRPLPPLAEFLAKVDESRYSMEDWGEALAAFHAWLQKCNIRQRPLGSMLGYVECCNLTLNAAIPTPDLSQLVVGMLDQYGFDAARKAEG
ncbi:MAG: hypothetical protein R3F31_26635 [Verrucomicrobiales bacterium]|nr:hypothetical protein [Verrucomicrobiae bacterium]MCP5555841.1 hypothetical protein [Akkermansiaceae bacterium]HRX54207.1 hypothetical protein [Verrucomicrobiales bacterium]